ncbi:hypothetical protein GI364_15130 [Alicyclobacillus sp. SO9]|nr:hypothetical protein GI364_15130 [Alicyclobacillus sp. SO9]
MSNWAVVDIAGSLMNRMVMILSRETSLKRALIHKIGINIVEICENVYHSKDMGYVAVQRYEYPQPMVKVGIMDLGIGIAASLEKRYKTLRPSWSDLDAIKLSIEPDVTSREGGGGLGLTQLSKFIRDEAHGLLSIRSGTGKLVISNAGTNREYSDLTYFPGTQIDMTIPIG